jgi:hypothetical protein
MGLVDRLKTYLNEEDEKLENIQNEPSSEGETADNRVHLQHIDKTENAEQFEKEGVSVSFSAEGVKAAQSSGHDRKKKKRKSRKNRDIDVSRQEVRQGDERQKREEQNTADSGKAETGDPKEVRTRKPRDIQTSGINRKTGADITDAVQKRNIDFQDGTSQDEMSFKDDRRKKKKHKKAAKKLQKEIKKKKSVIEGEGRRGKVKGSERIRSEREDIDNLIFKKATYEEAERQTVTDFCEQLVDVSYHMEDMKREYRKVTTYLEDIQRIDELPDEYRGKLTDIAVNIEQLGEDKDRYMQSENLLSQEQYALLAQLENEVPGTIKKLYDMEERDSMLKSDMGYLEGEKEDLKFMRGEYTDNIARIRGVMTTLLILGFITLGIIAAVAVVGKVTVTVYVLAVLAFVALVFAIGYARYSVVSADVKTNDARLSKAVSLLNKVKVKYINNTNTMEYIYDKYGVNSSNELEYSWGLYNTMVRDMLKYSETNKDIRKLKEELLHNLRKFGIHEPEIWLSQVRALADPREMVEVRHSLNQSRQKIRENLEMSERMRVNAVTALRAAVSENPGMAELIQDILTPYHLSIL